MVFTPEYDAYILMAHFRSGNRNADGSWTYSSQSCIKQFQERFPHVAINYDGFLNHKYRLVNRFKNKNCICKGKSTGRRTKLTQEIVDDLRHRMEQSPKKSVARLSTETGILVCFSALQL